MNLLAEFVLIVIATLVVIGVILGYSILNDIDDTRYGKGEQ